MTQLETSVACMMKVFDTYAGKDGKPDSLTKAEVKALLESELPGLLKVLFIPCTHVLGHVHVTAGYGADICSARIRHIGLNLHNIMYLSIFIN